MFDAIMASAYDVAKVLNNLPELKRPKLKKYGDCLPDFNVNEPNLRAWHSRARFKKFVWYEGAVILGWGEREERERRRRNFYGILAMTIIGNESRDT